LPESPLYPGPTVQTRCAARRSDPQAPSDGDATAEGTPPDDRWHAASVSRLGCATRARLGSRRTTRGGLAPSGDPTRPSPGTIAEFDRRGRTPSSRRRPGRAGGRGHRRRPGRIDRLARPGRAGRVEAPTPSPQRRTHHHLPEEDASGPGEVARGDHRRRVHDPDPARLADPVEASTSSIGPPGRRGRRRRDRLDCDRRTVTPSRVGTRVQPPATSADGATGGPNDTNGSVLDTVPVHCDTHPLRPRCKPPPRRGTHTTPHPPRLRATTPAAAIRPFVHTPPTPGGDPRELAPVAGSSPSIEPVDRARRSSPTFFVHDTTVEAGPGVAAGTTVHPVVAGQSASVSTVGPSAVDRGRSATGWS
jgi:hypothetical protein